MKKYPLILALILLFAWICFSAVLPAESQARAIINNMLKAMEANKGCIYTMHSSEKIVHSQDMYVEDVFTKVNVRPLKVYLKMYSGANKGIEILYAEGENNNKALVNPGRFLPDVRLSPFGSLMVKNEHHTIITSGFSLVDEVIKAAVKRLDALGKFDSAFKYAGDVTWNGRKCFKIVYEDDSWGYTSYTALPGENMYTVCLKRLISEYHIMDKEGIKSFEDDLGGRTLKVPSGYAKKTVLYIDTENYFPVYQEMSDDKGVFEHYEFLNLVVNPPFKPDEFSKYFSEYQF